MTIERYIRIIAGTFIMLSLALGVEGSPLFVSPWALAFTAFVGANLFQFGFTNFCPLSLVLRKLGVPESPSCCQGCPCGTNPSGQGCGGQCCGQKGGCCAPSKP